MERISRTARNDIDLDAIRPSNQLTAQYIDLMRLAIRSIRTPLHTTTVDLRGCSWSVTSPAVDDDLRMAAGEGKRRADPQSCIASCIFQAERMFYPLFTSLNNAMGKADAPSPPTTKSVDP